MSDTVNDMITKIEWLDSHNISYTLNEDGTFDAEEVVIENDYITELPVKFNKVFRFEVENVSLQSLKNFPTYCAKLSCRFTKIKSLKGMPTEWIHSNGEKRQILHLDFSNNYDLESTEGLVEANIIDLSYCPKLKLTSEIINLDYNNIIKLLVDKPVYKELKKIKRNLTKVNYTVENLG